MQKYIKYTILIIFAAILLIIIAVTKSRPHFPTNCEKTEIAYKTVGGYTLKMDLYSPIDTITRHPAVIYLHGGSWISGNRDKAFQRYRADVCKHLLDSHIAIITVDYRLINLSGNHLQDCLQDCHDAIRYCISNCGNLGIDTSKIALWGSSAGSHLAMLCYGKHDSDRDSNFKYIKVIINDFGPSDICTMWQKAPEWFRRKASTYFYGEHISNLTVFDSLSMAYSPISYINQLKDIPMLISQGGSDRIVNHKQSINLHDSLPESEFLFFENLGHGFKDMDDEQLKRYLEKIKEMFCSSKN